ncbi:hypothetical protein TanjilG_23134 [Lupinus angustifolius]|uniref:Uncharacterized protein n=1 Tax=Lupinus angustifolius TaxID=3871 RepID=A0A1J7FPC5_LUPAN|nr:hypothetical protein TanjilG_23134 [Lupinus angustifolius]
MEVGHLANHLPHSSTVGTGHCWTIGMEDEGTATSTHFYPPILDRSSYRALTVGIVVRQWWGYDNNECCNIGEGFPLISVIWVHIIKSSGVLLRKAAMPK